MGFMDKARQLADKAGDSINNAVGSSSGGAPSLDTDLKALGTLAYLEMVGRAGPGQDGEVAAITERLKAHEALGHVIAYVPVPTAGPPGPVAAPMATPGAYSPPPPPPGTPGTYAAPTGAPTPLNYPPAPGQYSSTPGAVPPASAPPPPPMQSAPPPSYPTPPPPPPPPRSPAG